MGTLPWHSVYAPLICVAMVLSREADSRHLWGWLQRAASAQQQQCSGHVAPWPCSWTAWPTCLPWQELCGNVAEEGAQSSTVGLRQVSELPEEFGSGARPEWHFLHDCVVMQAPGAGTIVLCLCPMLLDNH